jgi:hypothetical protein
VRRINALIALDPVLLSAGCAKEQASFKKNALCLRALWPISIGRPTECEPGMECNKVVAFPDAFGQPDVIARDDTA